MSTCVFGDYLDDDCGSPGSSVGDDDCFSDSESSSTADIGPAAASGGATVRSGMARSGGPVSLDYLAEFLTEPATARGPPGSLLQPAATAVGGHSVSQGRLGSLTGGPKISRGGKNARKPCKYVPHSDKPVHVVEKRNARERRRVEAVNTAFVRLRRVVPHENRRKRISKVKTLRIAIDYIHYLQELIDDHDKSQLQRAMVGMQQHLHHHHHHLNPHQMPNFAAVPSSGGGGSGGGQHPAFLQHAWSPPAQHHQQQHHQQHEQHHVQTAAEFGVVNTLNHQHESHHQNHQQHHQQQHQAVQQGFSPPALHGHSPQQVFFQQELSPPEFARCQSSGQGAENGWPSAVGKGQACYIGQS